MAEEGQDPNKKTKWPAIEKVHTNRDFSPSSLYSDMRSAWNSAKEVVWKNIEDNRVP